MLILLVTSSVRGQSRELAPDSGFSVVLPAQSIRTRTDLLGITATGTADAYDLPTRGGRGSQALLAFYSLPYSGQSIAAFADSIRQARAPTDPQDRAWFFAHPPQQQQIPAGSVYSWEGPCGDCSLTEVLVISRRQAAFLVYYYDDMRPVAQTYGRNQFETILKSLRWLR